MEYKYNKNFKGIIKDIDSILKRCQKPSRELKNYTHALCSEANCFIHAFFNFHDNDLKDLVKKHGEGALVGFWHVKNISKKSFEDISNELKRRVESTGLKVEECEENEILEEGQWKVAYYSHPYDYHFMRQEENGEWTSKMGWDEKIETFKKLPRVFNGYKLQKIFKVTNLNFCNELDEKE